MIAYQFTNHSVYCLRQWSTTLQRRLSLAEPIHRKVPAILITGFCCEVSFETERRTSCRHVEYNYTEMFVKVSALGQFITSVPWSQTYHDHIWKDFLLGRPCSKMVLTINIVTKLCAPEGVIGSIDRKIGSQWTEKNVICLMFNNKIYKL